MQRYLGIDTHSKSSTIYLCFENRCSRLRAHLNYDVWQMGLHAPPNVMPTKDANHE